MILEKKIFLLAEQAYCVHISSVEKAESTGKEVAGKGNLANLSKLINFYHRFSDDFRGNRC